MRAVISNLAVLLLLFTSLPPFETRDSLAHQTSNPAFTRVWERTDSLVLDGKAQRTWLWGPGPLATLNEPLAESPGGMREVQYYDKSRMEINNPNADPSSPWYVTNGLLVYEMVSGRMHVSATEYERRAPARISVAGDTITDTTKLSQYATKPPNYETLRHVATLAPGQNQREPNLGAEVTQVLEHTGQIRELTEYELGSARYRYGLPKLAYYESVTMHNIPDVFWNFMNQKGLVHENGVYREDKLIDWVYAMGYPITEPYWAWVGFRDGGGPVLLQAFQRRVLTYNPQNEKEWQVEMGNVGSHYYMWRYGIVPETPDGATTLPVRVVLNGDANIGPHYTIIKDSNTWTTLWETRIRRFANEAMPTVDFSRELLIQAAWGERTRTGDHLKVESARLKDRTLTITIRFCPCGVFTAMSDPVHFSAIPRTAFDGGPYTVLFLDTEGVILNRTELTLP